ncbi:hypothetical protein PB1_16884 [Bacillus methanolicus PB1]|uniref:YhcI n=1 Tax=Bacillus methanolicus PB1 TaxID=997296 RepID=I3DYD1_BACMT|nr:ABC transporter permease [Bacillus methanolicus]EIJ79252.1 hypothetical protein PB1_16884 [Bacillus methanolicus PB1]
MFSLVMNERKKLNRQKGPLVMRILLLLLILGTALIGKYDADKKGDMNDWKTVANQKIKENQKLLADEKLPASLKYDIQKEIDMNNYRLEKNLAPSRLWSFVNITSFAVDIITIFAIILAAGSIANEFSWGTIKLLMIRPVSRSKILLSKYLSTFTFVLELLFLLFAASFIIGGLFFGFDHITSNYLTYSEGKVIEVNPVIYIFKSYGLNCISLLIMTTFAFLISTLFRSSAISIGISIFFVLMGTTITNLLIKYDWGKYILFANTNLSQYINGSPIKEGMSLNFSLTVLAVYYLVFLLLTWVPFNKRDIAG